MYQAQARTPLCHASHDATLTKTVTVLCKTEITDACRFLSFTTGCDRAPVGGLGSLTLVVSSSITSYITPGWSTVYEYFLPLICSPTCVVGGLTLVVSVYKLHGYCVVYEYFLLLISPTCMVGGLAYPDGAQWA